MGHQGTSRGVPQHNPLSHLSIPSLSTILCPTCPSVQFSVPPVCPIPQSPRDVWDIEGRHIVSLSTILCPTCPSHPSVPKGHMGHQGTSHGVPQHNSLSHLSIPSLSPRGTYGTSGDVPWCPSAQFFVPPVHPIPQSPRDNGTSGDVPWCPSAQFFVPPVHPIPQSPRDIWDIRGRPMVSLSTILCPTCLSHPSVPKRRMGHRGTSHSVPQHNSLSHLSIPSLSPRGTYGTSGDVPWCPSAQFSVPPVHSIPQSPRDVWDIEGRPMVSLSTILSPTCPSHPSVPEGHMGHQGTSHGVPQHNSLSHLSIHLLCTILYFINITSYP